jgi:hypothetical protein
MKQIKLASLVLLLVATSSLFSKECPKECHFDYTSCDKVRKCTKNVLYPDGFNIRFHSGITPIIWKNRGCMSFLSTAPTRSDSTNDNGNENTNCVTPFFIDSFSCKGDDSTTPISSIQIPKFNKLFATPWAVGVTLGYAVDTHQEVGFQFNYTQARNRHDYFAANMTNTEAVPVLLHINFKKYKNTSGYFFYRYNFERMRCFPRDFLGDMAWFLGIKAGLLHHFGVRGFVESSFTSMAESSTTPTFNIFDSSTSFSATGEVGIDICFNCDWSLMIGAEITAGQGPSCRNVVIPVTELSSLSMSTAKIGAEILFPITFGLRYKF